MPHITLAVTDRVIQQVGGGHGYQRQLAVRGASPDLRALIATASAHNRVHVAICGVFELSIGDTGAIWGSHQAAGHQADDFAGLYALLETRPNVPVTFGW
jgi:CobQ-like glutamine amidotransferase family enzyme